MPQDWNPITHEDGARVVELARRARVAIRRHVGEGVETINDGDLTIDDEQQLAEEIRDAPPRNEIMLVHTSRYGQVYATFHGDPIDAGNYFYGQECVEDWTITRIYDLGRGITWDDARRVEGYRFSDPEVIDFDEPVPKREMTNNELIDRLRAVADGQDDELGELLDAAAAALEGPPL